MNPRNVFSVLCIASLIPAAQADLSESAFALCERVKVCAQQTLGAQMSDPSNQVMLDTIIDEICMQTAVPLALALNGEDLEANAQLCVDNALQLDCTALMAGKAQTNEACAEVMQIAEAAGMPAI